MFKKNCFFIVLLCVVCAKNYAMDDGSADLSKLGLRGSIFSTEVEITDYGSRSEEDARGTLRRALEILKPKIRAAQERYTWLFTLRLAGFIVPAILRLSSYISGIFVSRVFSLEICNCPHLQQLDLTGCFDDLTQRLCTVKISNCPRLVRVDVTGCCSLERVTIRGCPLLRPEGVIVGEPILAPGKIVFA